MADSTAIRARRAVAASCCLALVVLSLAVLPGCAARQPDRSAATPLTANAKLARDVSALGTALQSVLMRPTFFSEEPKGDLGESDASSPGVFTRIVSVFESGTVEVSFDVEQFYQGRQANGEAAKDGVKRLEGDWYLRNRYRHEQTLPLADDAAILIISSDEDEGRIYGRLTAPGESSVLVTPAEYEERRKIQMADSPGYAWIEVDRGQIVLLIEQFLP